MNINPGPPSFVETGLVEITQPDLLLRLALFFNLIVLVSTITVQIPMQTALDKKFSMDVIDRLIATDMIWRRIPMLLLALVNFIMLYKVVRHSGKRPGI